MNEHVAPTESLRVVSKKTEAAEARLSAILRKSSIPDSELAQNAALFLPPRSLKRLMFLDELYRKALRVHGVIMEFGTRFGRDIGVFDSLRTIYEPFNVWRNVICFDTFEGFPSIHDYDAGDAMLVPGGLATPRGYEQELEKVMIQRQELDPLPELKRYTILKGDAPAQLAEYLRSHPQTIVALAYFDMDIYEPTKACLELLKDHVTKGTILAFDELCSFKAPGETIALKEVYPLNTIRIRRSPKYSGQPSYFTIE